MKSFFILLFLLVASCAPQYNASKNKVVKPIAKTQKQVLEYNIGLLVPLSGNKSDIGSDIKKFVEITAEDTSKNSIKFNIKAYDTDKLNNFASIDLSSADIILGPLLFKDALELRKNNSIQNKPIVSLSNNEDIASENLFTIGIHPKRQLKAVIDNLHKEKYYNYYIIGVNNKLNNLLIEDLNKYIKNTGSTLVTIQKYNDQKTLEFASDSVIQSMSAEFNSKENNMGIGLLVLDDGENTSFVLDKMFEKRLDISKVKMILLGQHDDQTLQTNELSSGALYADIDESRFDDLIKLYEEKYKNKPYRISLIASEAVTILSKMAQRNKNITPELIRKYNYNEHELKFEGNIGLMPLSIHELKQK